MIDERHEELAALYALDLLEGAERAQFETVLARDPALQALVRELRESSAALAHTAPNAEPPPALKARVLQSIEGTAAKTQSKPATIIHFPVVPWAIAACFAVVAGWMAQLYLTARHEASLKDEQQAVANIALKAAQNQLEAERIVNSRRFTDLNQQATDATRQLAETTTRLTTAEQSLASARTQIESEHTATQTRLAELDRQLAAAQTKSGDAERALAETRQALATRETQLREQGQLLADLQAKTRQDTDLANFKIATLTSLLKNSPQAVAVAVWNPAKQEGVFTLDKPPAVSAEQSLELWVVEAKPGASPVSAGVFPISAEGTTRIQFKPVTPVSAIAAFAVSREKKDGARSHEKPDTVVMMGKSQ